MFSAWLGRQGSRYLEAARSTHSMPYLRIAIGFAFLALASIGAYTGSMVGAAFSAFAGLAMLVDGAILLRLR